MEDYSTLPDATLVSYIKQGDRKAFAEVYDRYALILYYKVNLILRDESLTKDLIQDLFTTIWTKSQNIRDQSNLMGYLYIAARNRALKQIRKGKARQEYLQELGSANPLADDMGEKLDEKELMLMLIHEMSGLPPKMKEVFHLSRIEELSHKEIAHRLNISEETVKKQVQNALKILKTRLFRYILLLIPVCLPETVLNMGFTFFV